MKLHETVSAYETEEKIHTWFSNYGYSKHRYVIKNINGVLTVNVRGSVSFQRQKVNHIPFKFGSIEGNFDCGGNDLTSLKNCPDIVHGHFYCDDNELRTLDYMPKLVYGNVGAQENYIETLHGIDNKIKGIMGFFSFQNKLKHGNLFSSVPTNLLGLFYIDQLEKINADQYSGPVSKIINKHLQGDRDIFSCQEELIEAGFIEQAKL